MTTGLEVSHPNAASVLIGQLSRKIPEARALVAFRCAQHAEAKIKAQIYDSFPGGKGNLSQSYTTVALGSDQSGMESAAAMSPAVYAGIQNDGGWIFPRVKQNLAIPAKGAPISMGEWPRHFDKGVLKFIPAKKINRPRVTGVLIRELSKNSKAEGTLMYILMPKVRLKGTRYIDKAAEAAEMGYPRIVNSTLKEIVEEAATKAGG